MCFVDMEEVLDRATRSVGNVKGILERQWGMKKSCDEVEIVREFTYLGDAGEDVRL